MKEVKESTNVMFCNEAISLKRQEMAGYDNHVWVVIHALTGIPISAFLKRATAMTFAVELYRRTDPSVWLARSVGELRDGLVDHKSFVLAEHRLHWNGLEMKDSIRRKLWNLSPARSAPPPKPRPRRTSKRHW